MAVKHEIINVPSVLYPVGRAPHARAISRAIEKIVKPRKSFCHCGRNCAVNKKYVAMIKRGARAGHKQSETKGDLK